MTVKSSISLSDTQYAFAKTMVASGQFPSVSAVIQHGVELLRQRTEDEVLEREALRALLAQRSATGTLPASEFDAQLGELLNDKRKAHGLAP